MSKKNLGHHSEQIREEKNCIQQPEKMKTQSLRCDMKAYMKDYLIIQTLIDLLLVRHLKPLQPPKNPVAGLQVAPTTFCSGQALCAGRHNTKVNCSELQCWLERVNTGQSRLTVPCTMDYCQILNGT